MLPIRSGTALEEESMDSLQTSLARPVEVEQDTEDMVGCLEEVPEQGGYSDQVAFHMDGAMKKARVEEMSPAR